MRPVRIERLGATTLILIILIFAAALGGLGLSLADETNRPDGAGLREALFTGTGVAAAVVLLALLLIYMAARRALLSPLRAMATAVQRGEPIMLGRSAGAVAELQVLASRYNTLLGDVSPESGSGSRASKDSLTGLASKARLQIEIEVELSMARRYDNAPCSLILVNLDHFHRLNERHGDLAGDRALAAVGGVLVGGLRESDTVGRWGGDEFLVVCRRTNLAAATHLAQTLRQLVAVHPVGGCGHCTASFGIATSHEEDTAATLLARAEDCLRDAKRTGRDRVDAGGGAASHRY